MMFDYQGKEYVLKAWTKFSPCVRPGEGSDHIGYILHSPTYIEFNTHHFTGRLSSF